MVKQGEPREPDNRMLRCVLDGHAECAARVPAACICNQMPRLLYLEKLKERYGEDQQ
ncbi:hypothetical protein I6F35_02920 [Bradyrhizobium sp. BRP22]|uniref:hypothetical protein n=1 Tax=Bradyrhizobium sp. BRP22 TaxID=2793821 RepID=UPI001CD2B86C|nr:hypothetical protein [Bradyrhizobium sp. BRP22]MCA1452167.1 hypothetical protein [Bradyrhizobium sp. BRP22]